MERWAESFTINSKIAKDLHYSLLHRNLWFLKKTPEMHNSSKAYKFLSYGFCAAPVINKVNNVTHSFCAFLNKIFIPLNALSISNRLIIRKRISGLEHDNREITLDSHFPPSIEQKICWAASNKKKKKKKEYKEGKKNKC